MPSKELGKLEKVDLREVWPNEANDFTPWLAEHLSELGNALGLELEFQSHEAPFGDFSLDILAHDLGRDRPVVIENQLNASNHDHLGKLLTYASGFDAGVVIWVAGDFREAHRQALDWLNQRTDTSTEFFGVVVEVLRIGDSRPAPNFKLVAFPNDWRKTNIAMASATRASLRGEGFRNFFKKLIDELRDRYNFVEPRKVPEGNSCDFNSGVSGVWYRNTFAKGRQVRVIVYIDLVDANENKRVFDDLANHRASLEAEFGESLVWEGLGNRGRAYFIYTTRPGSIEDAPETLEEITEWTIERIAKLKQVFGPRLDELVRNNKEAHHAFPGNDDTTREGAERPQWQAR